MAVSTRKNSTAMGPATAAKLQGREAVPRVHIEAGGCDLGSGAAGSDQACRDTAGPAQQAAGHLGAPDAGCTWLCKVVVVVVCGGGAYPTNQLVLMSVKALVPSFKMTIQMQ